MKTLPAFVLRVAILLVAMPLITSCGKDTDTSSTSGGQIVIRASLDPGAKSYELTRKMADEFEKQTGTKVELLQAPADATERLSQYLQYVGASSADVDIFQVDVIWPAVLSHHMVNLKPAFAADIPHFFPSIVQNNTVEDRLVALPWFGDAGLLYYRKDLLEKNGFPAPPTTWEELDQMATAIQNTQRGEGNPDFWGFVWQGRAYEGLTCNALEWHASSNGGTIVDESGKVTINNPQAAAAFARAAGWVGRISPPGVTTYGEEEARQMFQGGNAAFMRNWPYAYALTEGEQSPVRGQVGVARLPTGGSGHAATLGGWQLGVSRYSRHPEQAIAFVRHLASRESQKIRAVELSMLPTRMDLYDDPELLKALPLLPLMKEVFLGAVPRPSAQTGDDYNEVSTNYFQAVHRILTGQRPPAEALKELEATLKGLLN